MEERVYPKSTAEASVFRTWLLAVAVSGAELNGLAAAAGFLVTDLQNSVTIIGFRV